MKLFAIFFLSAALMPGAAFRVAELRAEHEVNPTGVVATPRLSWVLEASERGQGQGGFHLLASSTPEKLAANEGDLWKTKERSNGQRLLIPWNGQALKSGQKVFWKVKVLSLKGEESEWSAPAHFTVGAERKFGKVTRISGFESSNAVLNEIYQRNVVTLGNRLNAYLGGNDQAFGDGHALDRSARELLFHYDSAPALLDWIAKVHSAQNELGYFPGGPDLPFGPVNSDAGISVPHAVWWMSGDNDLILNSWERMENYMIRREEADITMKGHSWGAEPINFGSLTPEFVDLCYFGMMSRLMFELSHPARKPSNGVRYMTFSSRIQQKFMSQYLGEEGLLKLSSQDAQVLALRSSVIKKKPRKAVIEAFGKNAKPLKDLTAFAAKPLLPVLTLTGNQDIAFDLVSDPKGPWADPQNADFEGSGATEWMMANLLGIDTNFPGFQQVRLTPLIPSGNRLAWAKGHFDSPAGRISIDWKKAENGELSYKCTIPAGIFGVISLPLAEGQAILESGKSIEDSFGLEKTKGGKEDWVRMLAHSGSYHFTIAAP
jgi:hypothetical protein